MPRKGAWVKWSKRKHLSSGSDACTWRHLTAGVAWDTLPSTCPVFKRRRSRYWGKQTPRDFTEKSNSQLFLKKLGHLANSPTPWLHCGRGWASLGPLGRRVASPSTTAPTRTSSRIGRDLRSRVQGLSYASQVCFGTWSFWVASPATHPGLVPTQVDSSPFNAHSWLVSTRVHDSTLFSCSGTFETYCFVVLSKITMLWSHPRPAA